VETDATIIAAASSTPSGLTGATGATGSTGSTNSFGVFFLRDSGSVSAAGQKSPTTYGSSTANPTSVV